MPTLTWKNPIMTSNPTHTNHEETIHRLMLLYCLVSKITADGDCSHEMKRHLLPGRKVMTNLDSMLKSSNITQDGRVEGHVLSFSCKNSKITTRCWTLTGKCWIPPEKDSGHPRAKEKTQQDGRRRQITFRIKPHTCQRHSEGSNKPCAHQDPDTPQRLSQNCVWGSAVELQVSNGLLQGQGLRMQQTWVWHKPFWRRAALTPP